MTGGITKYLLLMSYMNVIVTATKDENTTIGNNNFLKSFQFLKDTPYFCPFLIFQKEKNY